MLSERYPARFLIPHLLALTFTAIVVAPADVYAEGNQRQESELYGGKTLDEWITQARLGRALGDRENALQIVRNFGLRHDRDKALHAFTELLSDKALTVRSLSAAGLRKAGKPTDQMAVAKLIDIISQDLSGLKFPRGTGEADGEFGLVSRVIGALEVIGEEDHVAALNRVSKDQNVDSTIRQAAEKAVRQIEKRARKASDAAKTGIPDAAAPAVNRYRILSASGEPVADAVVRLIHQRDTFRELVTHVEKYETKTDAAGFFEYPNGLEVAQEMDADGFSATWVTVPAHQGQPQQSWLLGTSAGVRFPFFGAVIGALHYAGKAPVRVEGAPGLNNEPPELPTVFHLPKFETTIRVIDENGSAAVGVEVTPSRIAWCHAHGAYKGIVVPEILYDSFRRTTDAEGRVTFKSIERMEFSEIDFRSDQHGWQRTFTNANTLGPDLVYDVMLFPAGKLTGTIDAATAEQKEFRRTSKLLLKTQVINLGLPAPKGFHIQFQSERSK